MTLDPNVTDDKNQSLQLDHGETFDSYFRTFLGLGKYEEEECPDDDDDDSEEVSGFILQKMVMLLSMGREQN